MLLKLLRSRVIFSSLICFYVFLATGCCPWGTACNLCPNFSELRFYLVLKFCFIASKPRFAQPVNSKISVALCFIYKSSVVACSQKPRCFLFSVARSLSVFLGDQTT